MHMQEINIMCIYLRPFARYLHSYSFIYTVKQGAFVKHGMMEFLCKILDIHFLFDEKEFYAVIRLCVVNVSKMYSS